MWTSTVSAPFRRLILSNQTKPKSLNPPKFGGGGRGGARTLSRVAIVSICLVLPVRSGREGTAEVGVASLPVPFPPAAPRRQRRVERREASERQQRWRRRWPTLLPLLPLERRDPLGADQRRAPAALATAVVGAGAVLVVAALRQLVDGRQLMVKRVAAAAAVVVVAVIQNYMDIKMFQDSAEQPTGWLMTFI